MTIIARDPASSAHLVDWWSSEPIDDDVQLSVGPGDVAVLVIDNDQLVELGPGRHQLTAEEHEELGPWLDDGEENVEVAFFMTTPRLVSVASNFEFEEDQSGSLIATAWIRITDASMAINLLDKLGEDETLEEWLGDEISIHVIGAFDDLPDDTLEDLCCGGAHNAQYSAAALKRANAVLSDYGVEVKSLENLNFTDVEVD